MLSHDEHCAIIWVLVKILNFLSKFLSFKGVSPRNEWRNPKNNKMFEFDGMMKWGIIYTISGWALCKYLSVSENFNFFVEIFEF